MPPYHHCYVQTFIKKIPAQSIHAAPCPSALLLRAMMLVTSAIAMPGTLVAHMMDATVLVLMKTVGSQCQTADKIKADYAFKTNR